MQPQQQPPHPPPNYAYYAAYPAGVAQYDPQQPPQPYVAAPIFTAGGYAYPQFAQAHLYPASPYAAFPHPLALAFATALPPHPPRRPAPERPKRRPTTRRRRVVYEESEASDDNFTTDEELEERKDRTFRNGRRRGTHGGGSSDDSEFDADDASSSDGSYFGRRRRRRPRSSSRPTATQRRQPPLSQNDAWETGWRPDEEQELGPIRVPEFSRPAADRDGRSEDGGNSDYSYNDGEGGLRRTRSSVAAQAGGERLRPARRSTNQHTSYAEQFLDEDNEDGSHGDSALGATAVTGGGGNPSLDGSDNDGNRRPTRSTRKARLTPTPAASVSGADNDADNSTEKSQVDAIIGLKDSDLLDPETKAAIKAALEDDDDEDDDDLDTTRNQGVPKPTVDRVLAYRRAGCDTSSADESILPLPEEVGMLDCEYLVKWMGRSHLHNEWKSFDDISSSGFGGLRKLENFFKKMTQMREQRKHMTEDEIEQQDVAAELKRQLDADSKIAERLICESLKSDLPSDELLINPSLHDVSDDTKFYLVKWLNLAYDQVSWETAAKLEEQGFKDLITEYKDRVNRLTGTASEEQLLNHHNLSNTAFEPYIEMPPYLNAKAGTLRDYQFTGINWILSRMKKGLSVLLADEMGLGKTVQTVAVCGHILCAEMIAEPLIVIVPQSTLDNWLNEFKRWLPFANVVAYHGNAQARHVLREREMARVKSAPFARLPSHITPENTKYFPGTRFQGNQTRRVRYQFDVCLATPSILTCVEDLALLRSIGWYMMVVDEAHLLKNPESKRFRELDLFATRYRLLLSGTPLHNNLKELWSLLRFLCPNRYGDQEAFCRRFAEVEKTSSVGALKEQQLRELQTELGELVLRRVKRDVEKSLPRKTERILRVEVSPVQAECFEAIIAGNFSLLATHAGGSKASLQNVCMQMKKVCNHPLLLRSDAALDIAKSANPTEFASELTSQSGKLALLDKLLQHLREKGHRVLIFSQMVRMLDLLSSFLILRKYRHQRLDGTMPRALRKKSLDQFNDPSSEDFCFLLSTRAGGLGINLTSADVVIIYDSDWNPQNDLQAEARAHRIGQLKTVQIFRLVTKDTIEERILERAKAKMVLDTLVVQGLNQRTPGHVQAAGFSKEELERILRFGASQLWENKRSSGSSDNKSAVPEVNLDKILAEAEERGVAEEKEAEGLADQLLQSFNNISDFRHEALDALLNGPSDSGLDDPNFWDNVIPEDVRKKYEDDKEAAEQVPDLTGVKRNRRAPSATVPSKKKKRTSKDSDDDDYVADLSDELIETKKRTVGSRKAGLRSSAKDVPAKGYNACPAVITRRKGGGNSAAESAASAEAPTPSMRRKAEVKVTDTDGGSSSGSSTDRKLVIPRKPARKMISKKMRPDKDEKPLVSARLRRNAGSKVDKAAAAAAAAAVAAAISEEAGSLADEKKLPTKDDDESEKGQLAAPDNPQLNTDESGGIPLAQAHPSATPSPTTGSPSATPLATPPSTVSSAEDHIPRKVRACRK